MNSSRKCGESPSNGMTGLVRDYLEQLAIEDAASGRRRRERKALEHSFESLRFKAGKRTWKRADLYLYPILNSWTSLVYLPVPRPNCLTAFSTRLRNSSIGDGL